MDWHFGCPISELGAAQETKKAKDDGNMISLKESIMLLREVKLREAFDIYGAEDKIITDWTGSFIKQLEEYMRIKVLPSDQLGYDIAITRMLKFLKGETET